MSTNTVKPGLRRKRARKVVENHEFDAFCRRILRAYARRVAAGDVEALRSLAGLASDVDAATRLAVAALRQSPYAYSWAEIANRLGTTRQAAQMRYGDRSMRGQLDHRLIQAGLAVSRAWTGRSHIGLGSDGPTPRRVDANPSRNRSMTSSRLRRGSTRCSVRQGAASTRTRRPCGWRSTARRP